MVTFGGDEVSGLVIDVGTNWTRAGYAGEDTPKCIFPTPVGYMDEEKAVSPKPDGDTPMIDAETEADGNAENAPATVRRRKYFIGDGELNAWRPNMEVKNPLKEGQVEDWDIMEQIWNYAFRTRLRVEPTEHPLFCTEPSWNSKENRHKLAELAFEKFHFPAFFLASDAAMTAFAAGRPTALVLSSGGAITSAVPVYDGFVLKKGILKQDVAGDFISEQVLAHLKRDLNVEVLPQYLIKSKKPVEPGHPADIVLRPRPETTAKFHHFQQLRVIHEWKESVGQVAESTYDEQMIAMRPQKPFEFPDGTNYNFGAERWNAPEIMFNPRRYIDAAASAGPESINLEQTQGVAQLIFSSVGLCDVELRPLLLNNVVVAGGNTLWQGYNDRLNWELTSLTPGSKIKIHAPGNTTERKCSSWLGGSILASLGTFHQLWVSRKEYEEYGPSIIDKKCH